MMFEDYRFILGSGSPRRRELLAGIGIPFEVEPVKGDPEEYDSSMPFDQVPEFLARHKSSCFGRPLADYEVLITADTMVCLDGQLLGSYTALEPLYEALGTACEGFRPEFVTVYYGADVDEAAAEALGDALGAVLTEAEVSVVNGGQPVYYYMISIE